MPFFETQDFFVKSVRFDAASFIDEFIDGLTRAEDQKKPRSPRMGSKKEFTVKDKVYMRSEGLHRLHTPEEIEKKRFLTANQSVSLVRKGAEIPVFGYNTNRQGALVGIITNPDDAVCSRYYMYDGGTIKRPYEFHLERDALEYYNKNKNIMMFASYQAFRDAVLRNKDSGQHNEVLASIRWNARTNAIGIFSDTDESRYVAQIYAAKLRQALKAKQGRLPEAWDDSYDVPIYYYLPGDPKNFKAYTAGEMHLDKIKANNTLADTRLRNYAFFYNRFACLLLADDPIAALTIQWNDNPIVLELMRLGLFHIAKDMAVRAGYEDLAHYLTTQNLMSRAQEICKWSSPIVITLISNNRVDILEIITKILVKPTVVESSISLIIAVKGGHSYLAQFFLDNGADVNTTDKRGDTPLSWAFYRKNKHLVELLLKSPNIDVNSKDVVSGMNVFLWAIQEHHHDLIPLLSKKGADVNAALVWSLERNDLDNVRLILNNCVHLKGIDSKNVSWSCLIGKNNFDIIHLCLKKQMEMNVKEANMVLLAAVLSNRVDIIRAVLERVDITTKPMNSKITKALLFFAVNKEHKDIVNYLCEKGINLNTHKDTEGNSPLLLAAGLKNFTLVSLLLANGANVNAQNNQGYTPVSLAAQNGNRNLVSLLVSKGGEVFDTKQKHTQMVKDDRKPHLDSARLLTRRVEAELVDFMSKHKLSFPALDSSSIKYKYSFFSSIFGCSSDENRRASLALQAVMCEGRDLSTLTPHKKALNYGELKKIYSNYLIIRENCVGRITAPLP